jgi:8-hydroxy-5-deazaflavin:NADPH oxidoreductase
VAEEQGRREDTQTRNTQKDGISLKIAILGGTGAEGAGLGFRWAVAGHEVIIGSRVAQRAEQTAGELAAALPAQANGRITGADNLAATQEAEIVVLSVPYSAQAATLTAVKEALAGKLLITVVVPLQPPKVSHVWRPPGGSAAQEAQALLGETTRVVAAFQNVSAEHLRDLDHMVDCDVLICGDRQVDKQVAIELSAVAGLRGVDAGPLLNAGVVEGLTAVLVGINIRHKIKGSGIRITGI